MARYTLPIGQSREGAVANIADVRWFLGNDSRTYFGPWSGYIQQACTTSMSAFVIAVVVRDLWDSDKPNTEDGPADAVIKLAARFSAPVQSISHPMLLVEEGTGPEAGGQPSPGAVGATLPVAATGSVPDSGLLGPHVTPRLAERKKVRVAAEVIEGRLRSLWEGIRTEAGISEVAPQSHDDNQHAMVGTLFGAFLKNPAMSDADLHAILNPSAVKATPQSTSKPSP